MQVEAGMWKKNGLSTTSVATVYLTGPWAEYALELDVVLLQAQLASHPNAEECVRAELALFNLSGQLKQNCIDLEPTDSGTFKLF